MGKIYLGDTLIAGGGGLGNPTLLGTVTSSTTSFDLSGYSWIMIVYKQGYTTPSRYAMRVNEIIRTGGMLLDGNRNEYEIQIARSTGVILYYKGASLSSVQLNTDSTNYSLDLYGLS